MGDPATWAIVIGATAAAVSGGTAIAGGIQQGKEAEAQAEAERRAYTARLDQRMQRTLELRGAQRVAAAASDLSLASPTFQNIERDRDVNFAVDDANDRWATGSIVGRLQSRAKAGPILGGLQAAGSVLNAGAGIAEWRSSLAIQNRKG